MLSAVLMKVLLTGGSGFIGSHVLACLQLRGIDVVTVGRSRLPLPVRQIEADLLNKNELAVLLKNEGVTHLMHLAWVAEHGKYWTSPFNLRWVEATTRLVEAFCEAGGQNVVIAGTCAEYDWSHGYLREGSTPLNPNTLYGTAKDVTRRLALSVCEQHGVACSWGRVFLPYGPGEVSSRLVPSLIDVFQAKRAPCSVNTFAYRDFLHVSDVANGFLQLVLSGTSGEYNISSGVPTRISEIVSVIAELLDADPEPLLALSKDRPGDPAFLVGENLRLKKLGWQPEFTLRQGLLRLICERSV